MKKISCNIIRDILPLYLDDVVSDDTRHLVEDHLCSCESCRKEASLLKTDLVFPADSATRQAQQNVLKLLKKQLRNKKRMASLLAVLCTILIFTGIYALLVTPKKMIPYDSSRIALREIDGNLYAIYTGDDLDGTVGWAPTTMEIDGVEKTISIFYFSESLWSNLKARLEKDSEESLWMLGGADEIDEIYYGKCDSGFPDRLPDAVKKATLIWRK